MELLTKEYFNRRLSEAESICILGHVSPDGDCFGSVLGVYNYAKALNVGRACVIQPYLEEVSSKFLFLNGSGEVSQDANDGKTYELAVVCDCGDEKRLGRFEKYYRNAQESLLIDHHFTNTGFGDYGLVQGELSSASEILYGLMEESLFNRDIAACIYTGIVHDTGVFRYSNTTERTLAIAGKCISQGIDFGSIIEKSFFSITLAQKQVLGYLLSHIQTRVDGRLVYGILDMATRKLFHAENMDMDGMIDQLRTTTGALMAAYLYETVDGRVKLSLRSNSELVDVSRVCLAHGGGGHKKAAGCFLSRDFEKNINEIEADLREQLAAAGVL